MVLVMPVTFIIGNLKNCLMKKQKELWDGIKNIIKNINDGQCKYGKDFTKTRFDTGDDLPLNKPLICTC